VKPFPQEVYSGPDHGAMWGQPITFGRRALQARVKQYLAYAEATDNGRADERIRARTKIILGGFE
jgi:hypothetical protein